MLHVFFYTLITLLLLTISYWDIKKRKIPNSILLCLFVISTLYITIQNENLFRFLLGMAMPSLILLVLNSLYKNYINNGDIKLLMVTGLLLGHPANLLIFVMSCILSIIFAIIYKTLKNKALISLPFAPFIALSIFVYKVFIFLIH